MGRGCPSCQLAQTARLPVGRPPLCSGDRRQVPSHAAAARVLRALLAGCRLVEELAPAVHRASLQLLAQLAHSFFMPLCLASLAALARIQVRVRPACCGRRSFQAAAGQHCGTCSLERRSELPQLQVAWR